MSSDGFTEELELSSVPSSFIESFFGKGVDVAVNLDFELEGATSFEVGACCSPWTVISTNDLLSPTLVESLPMPVVDSPHVTVLEPPPVAVVESLAEVIV